MTIYQTPRDVTITQHLAIKLVKSSVKIYFRRRVHQRKKLNHKASSHCTKGLLPTVVNGAPVVVLQWWKDDGAYGKAFLLCKEELEEGNVQDQLPAMINNVREQGWQGEVLPKSQKLLFSAWQNASTSILGEVEPGEAEEIREEKLNTSCVHGSWMQISTRLFIKLIFAKACAVYCGV